MEEIREVGGEYGEETCTVNRKRRMRRRNHVTTVMVGDGTTIRRAETAVGFRREFEGIESICYAVRTVITERKRTGTARDDEDEQKTRRREVANVKCFGRVRTQFTVLSEGDGRECNRNARENIEIIEEDDGEQVGRPVGSGGANREGRIGGRNTMVRRRRGRKRRRGGRRGGTQDEDDGDERPRRRSRRCRIGIEHFRLFGNDGTELEVRNPSSVRFGLSAEDKFRKSISATLRCTFSLQNRWTENTFLRCSGGERRDQKFICVATVRMKRLLFNGGGHRLSVVVSIIIKEESNKVRSLNVRREECVSSSGATERGDYNWVCSCDMRRSCDGLSDSPCGHMKCLRADAVMVEKLKSIVQCVFMPEHSLYFGETLVLKEMDCNGKYEISGGMSQFRRTEIRNGFTAIQLDDVRREDLVAKGITVVKKWSAWLVVDPVERLLMSVVQRPVRNGMVSRMICTTCHTDMHKKCCHEVECDMECEVPGEGEDEDSSDEYPDVGEDVQGDEDEGDEGKGRDWEGEFFWSAVSDIEIEDKVMPEYGGEGAQNVRDPSRAVNEADGYLPNGPQRTFMFCWTERWKTLRLVDLIETRDEGCGELLFSDPDDRECGGILQSLDGNRKKCKGTRDKSERDDPRKCTLLTLNHGAIEIVVLDWVCAY